MAYSQSAAGAIIINPLTHKLLLLKHRQGHWAFCQGKQEVGEELINTLHREVFEETGLRARKTIGPVHTVSYSFYHKKRKYVKTVTFWIVYSSDDVVLSSEHSGFIWVSFATAKHLVVFDNHKEILLAVKKRLDKQ